MEKLLNISLPLFKYMAAKKTKSRKKAPKKKTAKPKKKTKQQKTKKTAAEKPAETAPEQVKEQEEKQNKEVVDAIFADERVLTEDSDEAREFYNHSCFGKILEDGKVQLSLCEALYLLERRKIRVYDGRKHELTFEEFIKKSKRVEPNFWIRYCVFKNMRNRGYIIKTALKFGADFRVYDRGVKPGEDHARWIIYPVHEGNVLTWYEFAAKNRVAHSTKKRLMIGIVDDEGDVTYYEIRWIRP